MSSNSLKRRIGESLRHMTARDMAQLRARLDGQGLLADVVSIANALQAGYEAVRAPDGVWAEVPIGSERLATLKAAADLKLKLLNKVLPDIAQVKLTAETDEPIHVHLSIEESKL